MVALEVEQRCADFGGDSLRTESVWNGIPRVSNANKATRRSAPVQFALLLSYLQSLAIWWSTLTK